MYQPAANRPRNSGGAKIRFLDRLDLRYIKIHLLKRVAEFCIQITYACTSWHAACLLGIITRVPLASKRQSGSQMQQQLCDCIQQTKLVDCQSVLLDTSI